MKIASLKRLRHLIEQRVRWEIEEMWSGSCDPADLPLLKRNLSRARNSLEKEITELERMLKYKTE